MKNNLGRALKKLIFFAVAMTLIFAGVSYAVELVRQKNVATHIVFPIVDADGDAVTGAAGLDSEYTYFSDAAGGVNWTDCTNEATELQPSSGWYDLSLTQAEMNHDYVAVYVKTTTTGAKGQAVLIRTMAGVPSAIATTTTAGNTIDVASTGEVGLDFSNIKDAGGAHTLTNITIPTTTAVTNAVVLPTGTGAGQISLSSGAVTVGTNNDKTGYTASTVSDKTGYALTQTFPTNFSALAITVGGAVTAGTVSDKTGYTASTVSDKTGYSLAADQAVNVTKFGGTTVTARDIGLNVLLSPGTGTGQISLASGAVTVGTNNDKTGYTASTVSDKTGYSLSQTFPTNFSSLAITVGGAVTAGTVSDKTGYTASTVSDKTGYSLAADQAVNVTKFGGTTVTARDIGLSVLLSAGTGTGQVSLASGAVTVGTNNDKTGYTVSTVSDKTGYSLSTTGIDAIWDEVQSGHSVSGSFGKYLDAQVSSVGGGSLTAANIADAVWDEVVSGHLTAGTAGNQLNAAGSAGDPWATPLPGAYTGTQAGYLLQDLIKKSRGR